MGELEIWNGHPGKVLLEACRYCADPAHCEELSHLLSDRRYLGMKAELIHYEMESAGEAIREASGHTQFFGPGVNRPSRSEHVWILGQLARWSEIPFPRNYVEILERICAVGVYRTAARELGLDDVTYQRGGVELFDGVPFNTDAPLGVARALAA